MIIFFESFKDDHLEQNGVKGFNFAGLDAEMGLPDNPKISPLVPDSTGRKQMYIFIFIFFFVSQTHIHIFFLMLS